MKSISFHTLLGLCVLLPGCTQAHNTPAIVPVVASTSAPAIARFTKPFMFAYGTWEGKANVRQGQLLINAPNAQGGLGDNFPITNFSAFGDMSPVLKLTINPNNKVKALKLALRSEQGGNATWTYSLEGQKSNIEIVLVPNEGASLSRPLEMGKEGKPNLQQIMQWQIQGNWGAETVDVAVSSIELMAPDATIRAARLATDKRLDAEAEAQRKEQESLKTKYKRSDLSPQVSNVALVASDVLAVEILAGHISPSSLTKYVAQSGDTKNEKKDDKGRLSEVTLSRGGKELGWLIGPKRDWLVSRETFQGDPLLEFVADDATNYAVSSVDDAAFSKAIKPLSIGRKSTPTNWELSSSDMEMKHTLYLRLPKPLDAGKTYNIDFGALNTRQSSTRFVNDTSNIRSEAVHVNQIGYRPDDPAKRAFWSCWMGKGGALKLPAAVNFSLVDDKSGQIVFKGTSRDLWPADKTEKMQSERNFSGTDVMRLDFSSFKTPGRYRVLVEGIGTSYPFDIGANVWNKAFLIQMKGLYNQRSGVELGPPYTAFKKPRDMYPADAATNGTRVTWTKYRAVEGGGENHDAIKAGDTGKPAPGWGGYHDAGDWNPRRVTHMKVTMAQLEMLDLFPRYFSALKLNIPATKGVPDILTEAIFEFETFHRLQQDDGGVGYGLETQGDPFSGEVSWLQSMPIYALSPDYSSSWFYASVGARLARLLQPYDAKRAATYRASALAAFNWAEKDYARDKASGLTAKNNDLWQSLDHRNSAALELYRLTSHKRWHDIFLQNSVLRGAEPKLFQWGKAVQRDQAFSYARLPASLGDAKLKQKAMAAVKAIADFSLIYANNNAWNLTTSDQGKPQFIGFYSTPDSTDLMHAHFLTHDPKYLAGLVQSTQFQSGCNPNNIVYTSGLGVNPVKHPFKLDARRTGQPAPVGLTPYGNIDFAKWGDQQWISWPVTYFLSKTTTPNPLEWPTNEAYWDLGGWPALNEFTVDAWAPNVAVWGYLAARAPNSKTSTTPKPR